MCVCVCVRVCVWAGACLRLVTNSDAAAGVLFHYVSWLVGQDGSIQAVADVQAAGGMGARHGTLLTRAVPTARAVLRRALRSVPGTVAHSRLALRLAPTWRSRVVAACMSQVSHPLPKRVSLRSRQVRGGRRGRGVVANMNCEGQAE